MTRTSNIGWNDDDDDDGGDDDVSLVLDQHSIGLVLTKTAH